LFQKIPTLKNTESAPKFVNPNSKLHFNYTTISIQDKKPRAMGRFFIPPACLKDVGQLLALVETIILKPILFF
jgi:hypothetical protein